jgi:hypothetical protein
MRKRFFPRWRTRIRSTKRCWCRLKVSLAMEHVEKDSFWFDMKILLQTVWMLTLGRFRPIELHPEILKLKRKLISTEINSP